MEYHSIRTGTLRGDQKIPFDAFVLIGGKYITFVRRGDSFEGARLDRLKSKKVKKMFIRAEHEESYRGYLSQNIDIAYDRSSARPIESRVEIIQGSLQSHSEAVMENPASQANYNSAKTDAARYVDFLLKEKAAIRVMLGIENKDLDVAHHAVAVSTLSVAIAGRVGLPDEKLTQFLALGALVHDIGHLESKRESFQIAPADGQWLRQMDEAGRLSYMQHVEDGARKLQSLSHFDEAVIRVVAQHEERLDGTGYPHRLTEKTTDPIAMIVSTANDFDRFVLSEKLTHETALERFCAERMEQHPADQLVVLNKILKSA